MTIHPKILRLMDEIRNNQTDGASQLARQAVLVLKAAAEQSKARSIRDFLAEQRVIADKLIVARPAMAPVSNIVRRALGAVSGKAVGSDVESVRRFTISTVNEAVSNSLKALERIVKYGGELISDGDTIMTHSYSSTVVAVLKAGFASRGDIKAVVTRSGAGRTGERLARELAVGGIPVTFIDDTAVGLYIKSVNKVMLGADRICADGAVVNGIGSYMMALAANRAGGPVYVLCETLKFDPATESGRVDLEEGEAGEVFADSVLPQSVVVKNPHFDITPLELISGIVTENGLLTQQMAMDYLKSSC